LLLGILGVLVALIVVVIVDEQERSSAAVAPRQASVSPNTTTTIVAPTAQPTHVAVAAEAPPTLPAQTGRVVFREDDDPTMPESTRRIRREIWRGLEDYAKEAELTEEQWNRFLSLLQESAIQFGYVLNERGNHRMDPADFQPTSDDLGRDLEEQLAAVLDERQLRLFKFRFHSNLLPAQLARGNILQAADTPDERAWTPSVDGVWPAEHL
jgi:hypothetical protein